MPPPTIAAALLFVALSCPAFAQSPADHETHQGVDESPAQTMPPAGQYGGRHDMRGDRDMMGTDMMDRDDMGHDDMRGGGMMRHGMMGRGMTAPSRGPSVMFRMVFALMDADGDGTVSLSEFQAAHERIFRAMDSNKDGKLTQEEMQTFMRGGRSPAPQQ